MVWGDKEKLVSAKRLVILAIYIEKAVVMLKLGFQNKSAFVRAPTLNDAYFSIGIVPVSFHGLTGRIALAEVIQYSAQLCPRMANYLVWCISRLPLIRISEIRLRHNDKWASRFSTIISAESPVRLPDHRYPGWWRKNRVNVNWPTYIF